MNHTIVDTTKREPCPRCDNKAVLKETFNPDTVTLMCLECGFYRTEKVSFFMHIQDLNIMRETFGLGPLEKLPAVSRKF